MVFMLWSKGSGESELLSIWTQASSGLSVGAQVVVGLVMGYIAASISESFCHRTFGHAPKWLRRKWTEHPWLLGWLRWGYWSHTVIHHGKTFKKDFITQFRTTDEQSKLDGTLTRDEKAYVRNTRYGMTIVIGSFPFFMGPPAIVLPVLKLLLGNWAVVAAFLMLLLPPLLSMVVHPQIHASHREVSQRHGVLATVMRSRYIRRVIRHHWLHHKYPACNFNLLLLGDWILGTHRRPSPKDLKEMSEQGIPLD